MQILFGSPQHDSMDCGPASLRMVEKFYGKNFPQQILHDKCHITKSGVSLLGISEAAESIGFWTKGVKLTGEQLCEEVNFPCIVHWRQNHFVVYKIKRTGRYRNKNIVCVSDPAHGLIEYSEDELKKCSYSQKKRDLILE